MSILKEEISKEQYRNLSDKEIAIAINLPANITISLLTAKKANVLILAQDVILGLINAPLNIQQKWIPILGPLTTLLAGAEENLKHTDLMAFDSAVEDGLITTDQITAVWTKENCSIAESIFGANTIVTEQQIGEARNN